jgi:hypothetical protein
VVETSKALAVQFSPTLIRLHQHPPKRKTKSTGFIWTIAMTIDIQQPQSSKKKLKKDRKDSDDRKCNDRDLGTGDPEVTEVEGKKKKRKERKKEREEGAIDGAHTHSRLLCRGLTLMHCMPIHL